MSLSAPFCKTLGQQIAEVIGTPFAIDRHRAVSGGDINQSFCLIDSHSGQSYFLKVNDISQSHMFAGEVLGLKAISQSGVIKSPAAIATGIFEDYSFLVLEYLSLNSRGNEFLLGQQLAKMHRQTGHQFGFQVDNTIGITPQKNTLTRHWADFWRDCRLIPQLELAFKNGYRRELESLGGRLLTKMPELFADHMPEASLVHGDLWGGNKAYLDDGAPVIFDPASYYGDREVDIAMTHLFGGFGRNFYHGYESEWPLNTGYQRRQILYNLYHQLNHLNLFGRSYLGACINGIKNLL